MRHPLPVAKPTALGARSEPTLMIPGPCALHPDDLGRLAEQTRAHYGEEWSAFYSGVLDELGTLLDAHSAYILPGSGSAGLEAALRNQLEPGQTVVVPDTGFFGARLAEIAAALDLRVRVVEQDLGQPVDVDELARHFSGADGLACVHVESTTGIRHPVREMAQRARAGGLVVVLDGVASAGSELVQLRADGIDAFVSASQKGLGGPPGLDRMEAGASLVGWARVTVSRWRCRSYGRRRCLVRVRGSGSTFTLVRWSGRLSMSSAARS
ncbi:aminotransferase class V-fold PLP-dependent enzyme [Pseudonocardia sp. EC080625-04]|uniref:aminotransferase class V-fold PLP-dependent enzyme n=1 Tax=Pseudonocardia sp. EC080625-04 TaxID=1096868 RepID=UPI000A94F9AC|nr:aminotransferase class V-fold PLP-dependent enzyme [Pseudonocardia sp. EC080625-04]